MVELPANAGSRKTARPSFLRKSVAFLLDFFLSSLLAWDLAVAVGDRSLAVSLGLTLLFGIRLWFRGRIQPTPGEFSMGIRYLTSSSRQVVAEIQVLNPKLRLNTALLASGVAEMLLAFGCLAAWTRCDLVAPFGQVVEGASAFGVWLLIGALHLACSFYILSGSRLARSRVPMVHALTAILIGWDLSAWTLCLPATMSSWIRPAFIAYCVESVLLGIVLVLSRNHLVHRYQR